MWYKLVADNIKIPKSIIIHCMNTKLHVGQYRVIKRLRDFYYIHIINRNRNTCIKYYENTGVPTSEWLSIPVPLEK